MERELGTIAEAAPLTVVLTVPAIWPEPALKKMAKAAELAGIRDARVSGETVLSFVTEPEAAAISTIFTVVPERPDVKRGDSLVILDLGGQYLCPPHISIPFKQRAKLTMIISIVGGTAVGHVFEAAIVSCFSHRRHKI